jgi:hypothetical protein
MTFDTILVFDNLINEIPRDQRMDIFLLSCDEIDWEYNWSLDIMHLNFPFLY